MAGNFYKNFIPLKNQMRASKNISVQALELFSLSFHTELDKFNKRFLEIVGWRKDWSQSEPHFSSPNCQRPTRIELKIERRLQQQNNWIIVVRTMTSQRRWSQRFIEMLEKDEIFSRLGASNFYLCLSSIPPPPFPTFFIKNVVTLDITDFRSWCLMFPSKVRLVD